MYILFWDVHIILDLYIWDVIMYKIIWDLPKVFWVACIESAAYLIVSNMVKSNACNNAIIVIPTK